MFLLSLQDITSGLNLCFVCLFVYFYDQTKLLLQKTPNQNTEL